MDLPNSMEWISSSLLYLSHIFHSIEIQLSWKIKIYATSNEGLYHFHIMAECTYFFPKTICSKLSWFGVPAVFLTYRCTIYFASCSDVAVHT